MSIAGVDSLWVVGGQRLKGPAIPFTRAWLDLVEAALEREGWGQHDLAREARVSQTAISRMMAMKKKTSRAVGPVAKALGIPLPMVAITSLAHESFVDDANELGEIDPSALADLHALLRKALDKHRARSKR